MQDLVIEVIIKVSDETQTLKVKHLLYKDSLLVSHDSDMLKDLVNSAIAAFKGDVKDVDIIIKYSW